MMEARLNEKN